MKRKKIERLTIEDCRKRCAHYNNVNPYGWEYCEACGVRCADTLAQGLCAAPSVSPKGEGREGKNNN